MKIRRYYGKTIREAIQKVRAEQGPDSIILSNREVEGGIEIIAAVDFNEILLDADQANPAAGMEQNAARRATVTDGNSANLHETAHRPYLDGKAHGLGETLTPAPQSARKSVIQIKQDLAVNHSRAVEVTQKPAPVHELPARADKNDLEMAEMKKQLKQITLLLKKLNTPRDLKAKPDPVVLGMKQELDSIRGLLQATADAGKSPAKTDPAISEMQKELKNLRGLLQTTAGNTGVAGKSYSAIRNLHNELKSLKDIVNTTNGSASAAALTAKRLPIVRKELNKLHELMDQHVSSLVWGDITRRNPVQARLLKHLMQLDLSPKLCKQMVAEMQDSDNDDHAWRHALVYLANKLPVIDEDIPGKGGIFAFHGPTGVGKTTTIAKLAARYSVRNGSDQVAVLTMDNHRIGAHEQLRTYANLLNIKLHIAIDEDDLRDKLHSLRKRQLILIDTAGLCHHDYRLSEQLDLFHRCSDSIKNFLVLASTTNEITLEEIISTYKKINLHGSILTKVDETGSLGNVLSILINHQLPIAYVCDGQRVPEDIFAARAYQLVSRNVALMKRQMAGPLRTVLDSKQEKAVVNA